MSKNVVNLKDTNKSTQIRDWFSERVTDQALASAEAHIRKFIKDNINWFTSNGLTGPNMTYGPERQKALWVNFGIDIDEYKAFSKINPTLKTGFENVSDELQVVLIYAYYRTKKDIFMYFLMFKIFTSRLAKFYKNGINKQRMTAVLENLPNSFDLKRFSSITELFDKKNATAIEWMYDKKKIIKLTDADVLDIVNSYSTRINNMIRFFSDKQFYTSTEVMYGLSDIKENQLEHTNNSLVLEGILSDIKRDFSIGKFDKKAVSISHLPQEVLKQCGELVYTYIRVSFEDFIGRVGTDINVIKNEWSKYCISGRKRPAILDEIVIEIQDITELDKLKDKVNTYCLIEIYSRISPIR